MIYYSDTLDLLEKVKEKEAIQRSKSVPPLNFNKKNKNKSLEECTIPLSPSHSDLPDDKPITIPTQSLKANAIITMKLPTETEEREMCRLMQLQYITDSNNREELDFVGRNFNIGSVFNNNHQIDSKGNIIIYDTSQILPKDTKFIFNFPEE